MYDPEKQLQFVSDAVMVFAVAFKAMHQKHCKGVPGMCPQMREADGQEVLEYLKKVRFEGAFLSIYHSIFLLLFQLDLILMVI